MGLDDAIRDLIGVANGVTAELQPTVKHYPATGWDGSGQPTYGSGKARTAIIEDSAEDVVEAGGRTVAAKVKVTFLDPAPVAEGDKVELPAVTGKPKRTLLVKRHEGLLDPKTGSSYMTVAWLGDVA